MIFCAKSSRSTRDLFNLRGRQSWHPFTIKLFHRTENYSSNVSVQREDIEILRTRMGSQIWFDNSSGCTYKFNPIPTASDAIRTLQLSFGSLNRLAWSTLVADKER
jgi:hypothetical protein